MTPAFDAFVAPARSHNQFWRLCLGFVVIVIFWFGTSFIILWGGQILFSDGRMLSAIPEIQDGSTPFGMFVLLASFLGLFIAPIAASILLHRRGFRSLMGPLSDVMRDFVRVVPPLALFYGLQLVFWNIVFDPVHNMTFRDWLILLPLGLAGMALQTLAEEITFRGYLMQQLAARFRSPLVWMVLPSFAFGTIHFTSSAGMVNGVLIVAATGLFGLIAADLTRRRGNLGAAWGLHFLNNCFAILILATDGNLPGLALLLTPYGMETPDTLTIMLLIDMVTLLIAWWILVRVFKRSGSHR